MAYNLLCQKLPIDIVRYCIVPFLLPSEDSVRSNYKKVMKYAIYYQDYESTGHSIAKREKIANYLFLTVSTLSGNGEKYLNEKFDLKKLLGIMDGYNDVNST